MSARMDVGSGLLLLAATPAVAQQGPPDFVMLGPEAEVVFSARGTDLVVDGEEQVVATDLAEAIDNPVYLEFVRELALRIDYDLYLEGDRLTLAPAGSEPIDDRPTIVIGDEPFAFRVQNNGAALAKAKFGDGEFWISNYQVELTPNEHDVALLADLTDCRLAFPGHARGFDVHVLEDEDGSPVYVATAAPGQARGGPPVTLSCGE